LLIVHYGTQLPWLQANHKVNPNTERQRKIQIFTI